MANINPDEYVVEGGIHKPLKSNLLYYLASFKKIILTFDLITST